VQLERIQLCHTATLKTGRGALYRLLSTNDFSIQGSNRFPFITIGLGRKGDALVWTSILIFIILIRVAANG